MHIGFVYVCEQTERVREKYLGLELKSPLLPHFPPHAHRAKQRTRTPYACLFCGSNVNYYFLSFFLN